jgi:hypothetical protein
MTCTNLNGYPLYGGMSNQFPVFDPRILEEALPPGAAGSRMIDAEKPLHGR